MTIEEILTKEFALRLGKVVVKDEKLEITGKVVGIDLRYSMITIDTGEENAWLSRIIDCKPYLIKPENLSEEKFDKYRWLDSYGNGESFIDFCTENNIDYKGLINKGLAYEIN
jgi:hypothetical protein